MQDDITLKRVKTHKYKKCVKCPTLTHREAQHRGGETIVQYPLCVDCFNKMKGEL